MNASYVLSAIVAAAATVGCVSTTGAPGAHRGEQRSPMMGEMCPMTVPGTTITVEEHKNGGALVFTAKSGDVLELQQRLREMAKRMAGGQCPMMAPDAKAMPPPAERQPEADHEAHHRKPSD